MAELKLTDNPCKFCNGEKWHKPTRGYLGLEDK